MGGVPCTFRRPDAANLVGGNQALSVPRRPTTRRTVPTLEISLRSAGKRSLTCYLDQTGEALAGILRPGNFGANTATDHVEVLEAALAQLPDEAWEMEILARADSARGTHDFLDALGQYQIRFSVGFDLTGPVREAVLEMPESAWLPSITQDGEVREGAVVAELKHLDLSTWRAWHPRHLPL